MSFKVSLAALFGLALLAGAPAAAQVQLNVCGVPPLPPCQPQVQERVIIERDGPRRGPPRGVAEDRLSRTCLTRNLRCRVDEPRPPGARCICETDDGEEVIGRIR